MSPLKNVNLCLRTVFHVLCFILFCGVLMYGFFIWFTISEEQAKVPLLKDLKVLTPFFFTNWNFVFQTLFLGLSVFYDVSEWMDKNESTLASRVKYWRDVVFKGMVVPFTMFVTSMFWCVYAIDRELVFPQVYDEVVPWWFNHCVHTNITIVIIIETILQARRKPTDKKLELIFYWAIAFAYAIVYYTIYFVTKRWLYQVFGTMTWWQVCLYQLFIWGISYVFYIMQFPINRLIHGKEEADVKETEITPKDNGVPFSKTWSMKFGNTKADENSRL